MSADRYLKVILTIVALELGWIALTLSAPPVAAQAQAEPTPVIISGIELRDQTDFLPVGVLGQPRRVPAAVERAFQPLDTNVRNDQPLRVTVPAPIRIETDRPIKVENVGYTPARRPGE